MTTGSYFQYKDNVFIFIPIVFVVVSLRWRLNIDASVSSFVLKPKL